MSSQSVHMKLITVIFLVTCVQGHGEPLEVLFDDYWQWFLGQFPEYASRIGEYRWNGQRQSYNISVYTERKETVKQFSDRLHAIDLHNPSDTQQRSFDIFDYLLQTYLDGYQWFKYGALNPVSFMEGPHLIPMGGIKNIRIRTVADFEDCLSRLAATRTQLSQITNLMREAIRIGRTLHNVSMNRVPRQIDKILEDDPSNSSIFQKLNTSLQQIRNLSTTQRENLRLRATQIIQTDYMEPYRELKAFIQQEYMPNTRVGTGVDSWPNGQNYYKKCLKWHLSEEKSPQEIHQLGIDEVNRISAEMNKIMKRQDFSGSIAEYFRELRKDPKWHFRSSEEITQEYTKIIAERINPHLSRIFKDIPDLPVVVKSTPVDGVFAYYNAGHPDGSTPGTFWINTMRPNETYSFDMMALAAHEVNPGHHFQTSYALKQDMPSFRKFVPYVMHTAPFNFPAFTVYKEGWALYAETLAQEIGLYNGDYELMGRYASEIFRACRLVVDTGLHAFQWPKQRAIQYMLNYTSFTHYAIEKEVDRYITWPGQACSYKYGELKIRELKRRAKSDLGSLFDEKDFHAAILNLGPSPMATVEHAVDSLVLSKGSYGSRSHAPGFTTWILVTGFSIVTWLLIMINSDKCYVM